MKRLTTVLLTLLGLHCGTACSQQQFENADVQGFSLLVSQPDVVVLDVRTAEEYAEGHLAGAVNIDVKGTDFLSQALGQLDSTKTIAVYCRSGRRSAAAATLLAKEGFRLVNLVGGIMAWQAEGQPVTCDTHERDVFLTKSGKHVEFYALMHASIRIVYDGKEIYVDPVSQLGGRIVDYALLPKADYILVTHEHGDHFNPETIQRLQKEGTRLVTNRRCAEQLGMGDVMGNGDCLSLADDMTLEAVPAYNITEGHLQFHPKGRDNGFVLTLDGLRIYIAGDTEDIPEMEQLAPVAGQQEQVDIAFLPCNQPYTMTTSQLEHAAKMVQPKVLFPYHYGQTDVSVLPSQLEGQSIDVRIRHYE